MKTKPTIPNDWTINLVITLVIELPTDVSQRLTESIPDENLTDYPGITSNRPGTTRRHRPGGNRFSDRRNPFEP